MRGGKGYLMVSQGIDAPDIEVGTREFNTATCCHCNRVVVLNPERKRARGNCFKCNAYVCDHKVCMTECNPFMQSIELAQKYDGQGAFLLRGPNGELLFDPALRDKERIF